MAETFDLEAVVQRFRDTNQQLDELAAIATRLQDSAGAFDSAKAHAERLIGSAIDETKLGISEVVEASSKALETSQRALRDSASNLVRLIDQLKDASRELADTADAFRKADPESLLRETLRSRTEMRVAILASSLAALLGLIAL